MLIDLMPAMIRELLTASIMMVLRGALGVRSEEGQLAVTPHIPENRDYFMVENLWLDGVCYRIIYDKNGEHYYMGKGLTVIRY